MALRTVRSRTRAAKLGPSNETVNAGTTIGGFQGTSGPGWRGGPGEGRKRAAGGRGAGKRKPGASSRTPPAHCVLRTTAYQVYVRLTCGNTVPFIGPPAARETLS